MSRPGRSGDGPVDPSVNDVELFEQALAGRDEQQYALRLYVVGATAASQRAVTNLRRICEQELAGRYVLEVVDVYLQPELAVDAQVLAAPTLVRLLPEPVARLVGDMSDRERVLVGLDLRPMPPPP